MDKLHLDELHPTAKSLVISMLAMALDMEKQGFNKEKYMLFCEGIWESMKMSDPEDLKIFLIDAMIENHESIMKKFVEGNEYNGHCC